MKSRKAIQSCAIVVLLHVVLIAALAILNRAKVIPTEEHAHVTMPVYEPDRAREEPPEIEPEPEEAPLEEPELPNLPVAHAEFSPQVAPVRVSGHVLDPSSVPVLQNYDIRAVDSHTSGSTERLEGRPFRAESVDTPPRWRDDNARPSYPLVARRHGWSGSVTVRLLIDEQGAVQDVKVLRSEGRDVFRRSVLAVASGWRFEPARHEGRPVRVWLTQPYRFEMTEGER